VAGPRGRASHQPPAPRGTVYFAELTSPQVAQLLAGRRTPVLLLPVGAVEPHGPHGPLCTDELISTGMCVRAVHRLQDDPWVQALILPPLPYGVTRCAAAFAGAVGIGEQALHAVLVDVCLNLIDQGLRWIVLVNNHFEPEHIATLRRAVTTVLERTGVRIGYLNLLARRNVEQLTDEFRSAASHAGQYETSLVLADRPELVDTERMVGLPPLQVNLAEELAAGRRDFVDLGMTQAYCGAPADATAAEGEATFEILTELLVGAIREVTS
jgi:creatinine amidohydrolase